MIEVIGGLRPAYEWVRGALMAGKSVVTANKQLMAHHGPELLDLARSRGREVRFEASVAGGIPVLRALQEGLAGDRLVEVRGILNGTCNYILSRMQAEAIVVRRCARRGAARRLCRSGSERGSRRRGRGRQARNHRRGRPAAAGARHRDRDAVDPADRTGRLRIRAPAWLHDPPDRPRVGRRQRRRLRRRPPGTGPAHLELRPQRRQPESRDSPRCVRRRNVVLGFRCGRLADRRGRGLGRIVSSTRRERSGTGRRADRVPQRRRRLRRAALRALHRQRQTRASSRRSRPPTRATASTSRACCSCRSSARTGYLS